MDPKAHNGSHGIHHNNAGPFLHLKREMFSAFYAQNGRYYKPTCAARGKTIPAEVLPSDVIVLNFDERCCWDSMPGQSRRSRPLVLECFNCLVTDNTVLHHTTQYLQTVDQSDGSSPAQLVVRRGQRFKFSMSFDRPYNPVTDEISFTFQFGDDDAGMSNGSRITVKLSNGIKPNNWSVGVVKAINEDLVVQFSTPSNAIIGKAKLIVDTEVRRKHLNDSGTSISTDQSQLSQEIAEEEEEDEGEEDDEEAQKENHADGDHRGTVAAKKRLIVRYVHHQRVYFLFNPWNKDDQVYIADDKERSQYVLSDFGELHFGAHHFVSARPWHFGQFERGILDCCFHLLDSARLRSSSRGSAVNVVRAIAKLVSAADDLGVIEANWSGHYGGGTPPTLWLGSAAVLKEFMKTKAPVKFGQCWIISAVATTVCRALGIPTRCVTNFGSAHDCDGVNTINLHWNGSGEPIDEWSTETVWNFHLWNESFMTRPDINAGLPGSWQTFDATPQVASDGLYCAGPCPVTSVKRGEIAQRHDCSLLFFGINTDIIHWTLQQDGSWRTTLEKNRTGQRMITEDPNAIIVKPVKPVKHDKASKHGDHARINVQVSAECLDVTREYKYPAGSEEERASLQRASIPFTYPAVYDKGEGDVKFDLMERAPIPIGAEFDVVVNAQNTSRYERTVNLTLTLVACHYTGLTKTKIRSQIFNFNLCSLRNRQVVLRISPEDYSYVIAEFTTFRVYMHATVDETDQLTATFVDFFFLSPQLKVSGHHSALLGQSLQCSIKVTNPLMVSLQNCSWMIYAPGMEPESQVIPHAEIEPYETGKIKVKLTSIRTGKLHVMASFHSNELCGIPGSMEVNIDGYQAGDNHDDHTGGGHD